MAEYTPGPWEIGEETYFHGDRSDGGKSGRSLPLLPIRHADERPFGREVALVWFSLKDQGPAAETDLANARLISAAPDLLAACNGVAAWLPQFLSNHGKDLDIGLKLSGASEHHRKWALDTLAAMAEDCRTAIAKATQPDA